MNMKKIFLNDADFVVNTMIAINRKEGRRIIDYQDVENYQNAINENFSKKEIHVIRYNCDVAKECEDDFSVIYKDKNYYAMLPWISWEDLIYKYYGYLPINVACCFSSLENYQQLLKRSPKDLQRFSDIYEEFLTSKQIELQKCANSLEEEVHGLQKKLTCITSLRK